MKTVIRPPRPGDASAIADLAQQLGYAEPVAGIAARLSALEGTPHQAVFVAENESGKVIGWTQVCGVHRLLTDPFAELAALVIDERHRGSGIGRELVRRALHWAAAEGYSLMRVRTNIVRKRAHHFYEDLGFERTKTQYIFQAAVSPHGTGPDAQA